MPSDYMIKVRPMLLLAGAGSLRSENEVLKKEAANVIEDFLAMPWTGDAQPLARQNAESWKARFDELTNAMTALATAVENAALRYRKNEQVTADLWRGGGGSRPA